MTRWKCSTKGCPFSEELHENWCGHGGKPTHLHWPKKGMGGNNPKSKIVAIACWPCHNEIDNNMGSVYTKHIEGLGLTTWGMDLHGGTLFTKVLEPDSAAGEAVAGEESAAEASPSPAAPSGSGSPAVEQQTNSERVLSVGADSSTAEPPVPVESVGEEEVKPVEATENKTPDGPRGGDTGAATEPVRGSSPTPSAGAGDSHGPPASPTPAGKLTHEKRVEICAQIRWMQQDRQWHTGDTANEWETELGVEEFNNLYANEFGYSYPSLRNCMRVAKKIPENERHYEVSFGHEAAVYAWMNLEDRDAWLPRAHDEGWNVARFKDALRGEGLLPPRKTVKRWNLEELRHEAGQWIYTFGKNDVFVFLDFLEAQK